MIWHFNFVTHFDVTWYTGLMRRNGLVQAYQGELDVAHGDEGTVAALVGA